MEKENRNKEHQRNFFVTVIIITLIMIVALSLSLTSLYYFTRQNRPSNTKLDTEYIVRTVSEKMGYDNLSKISGKDIYKYYEINEKDINDSCMYISTRNDSFTEITCFRLTSPEKEESLRKAIDTYTKEKLRTIRKINDKSVDVSTYTGISVQYPYVFVVFAADTSAAITSFESVITRKK